MILISSLYDDGFTQRWCAFMQCYDYYLFNMLSSAGDQGKWCNSKWNQNITKQSVGTRENDVMYRNETEFWWKTHYNKFARTIDKNYKLQFGT